MNGTASIGECMLELSGHGAEWRMGHAGDTFNTLWALRAILPADKPTDFVSAFGDDPFSAQQLEFFQRNGIGTAASPHLAGARPGLYAITLDGHERSFTYWRADAAARRLADDPEALRKSLENRSLVYFSGITLAILTPDARATLLAAISQARHAGSRIAFDPNYRPRLWSDPGSARAAIDETLKVVDIALPTFPDEQMLFGDMDKASTAERISASGVGEIVVKDGTEPALVAARDVRECVPAVNVERPVDTTGAGDSFNGGYLAARLLGYEPSDAVERAHLVAAATVQVHGALAPVEVLRAAFSA